MLLLSFFTKPKVRKTKIVKKHKTYNPLFQKARSLSSAANLCSKVYVNILPRTPKLVRFLANPMHLSIVNQNGDHWDNTEYICLLIALSKSSQIKETVSTFFTYFCIKRAVLWAHIEIYNGIFVTLIKITENSTNIFDFKSFINNFIKVCWTRIYSYYISELKFLSENLPKRWTWFSLSGR